MIVFICFKLLLFIKLKFYSQFTNFFNKECVLYIIKYIFCIYWNDCFFLLGWQCVYYIYGIFQYWYVLICKSLNITYSWSSKNFHRLLYSLCLYVVEDFRIMSSITWALVSSLLVTLSGFDIKSIPRPCKWWYFQEECV